MEGDGKPYKIEGMAGEAMGFSELLSRSSSSDTTSGDDKGFLKSSQEVKIEREKSERWSFEK